MTDNAASVIPQCPTECTYDDDFARFTVQCQLPAGHTGRHRGLCLVEFAALRIDIEVPEP